MLMVCVLHINLFGRYNEISWQEKPWEWLSWGGTESLCIIAVNLYAMITGYVCIASSWRISRYITLWFQVAFYTVGIYALGFFLAFMGWIPSPWFREIFSSLFPLPMVGAYWYFNAYTILFLLIPFLNKLLPKLSCAEYAKLMLILLLILPFTMSGFCLPPGGGYGGGYNAGWLTALYCAGAFIRLHPIPVRKPSILLIIYLLGTTAYFIRVTPFLQGKEYSFLLTSLFTAGYASPFSIVSALSLFLIFKELDIKQRWLKKAIRFVAPLTFGVYLVQCHPTVMRFLFSQGRQFITKYGHPVWVPLVGGLSLFIACACVDWVRLRIFQWCHTRMLADKLEAVLIRIWGVVRARCGNIMTDTSRHP